MIQSKTLEQLLNGSWGEFVSSVAVSLAPTFSCGCCCLGETVRKTDEKMETDITDHWVKLQNGQSDRANQIKVSSLLFRPPLVLLPPFLIRLSIFFNSHPLSHLLFQPRFSSSPLSPSLTYARLAPPSSSSSFSSSSSSLVLLFFFFPSLPPFLFPPLSGGAALHAKPLPSPSPLIQPLIRSIHYTIHRDMIRWLCMGLALLLPILALTLTHTHTHTHTHPAPLALMELDVAFPLKILWMSSVRESWQPGAPPINLSLRF